MLGCGLSLLIIIANVLMKLNIYWQSTSLVATFVIFRRNRPLGRRLFLPIRVEDTERNIKGYLFKISCNLMTHNTGISCAYR